MTTKTNQAYKIIVIGGAGFIGSHMVKYLSLKGNEVITFDNLATGFSNAVCYGKLVVGDLSDQNQLQDLFKKNRCDAVFHFASSIEVGESVINPYKYYNNNVINTINLLEAMRSAEVNKIIFSSTAAIFGEPEYLPIDENHNKKPINTYGKTKWMVENILEDYDNAYGLKYCSFRYFNAAGADSQTELGERHQPESHLIPLILQVASGRKPEIKLFGKDYKTPDGTCIRDYIHVEDLCSAHWLGMEQLMNGGKSDTYNLGNGKGYSVQEVIHAVEKVTNKTIKVIETERRKGDPDKLIASSEKAKSKLGWIPKYSNLETMIEHAWQWEISSKFDKE